MVVVPSLVVANAATLGGATAKSLLATSPSSSVGAPTTIGCDNFTGTDGTSLSGRSATVATACSSQVWTVHVGAWTIQANGAVSDATASAVASENTSTVDSTAQVVISSLNTGGRIGGVVLSHDGTANYLAAVMIDGAPDRIELRLVAGASVTVLTTLNPVFATSNTLSLSRSGATLTVNLNGVVVGGATLTSTQVATIGAGARAGLFGGSASVGFDDFSVTAP
ncbi:MAG TPA: hypothetical protein VHN36_08850 [Ilumatobacteraceae bacterium]|nr:hypothetical protein [Ilumatobacteraceae bacterium]